MELTITEIILTGTVFIPFIVYGIVTTYKLIKPCFYK